MRVLVTGAQGQLGRALNPALCEHEVLSLSREDCDICDYSVVRAGLRSFRPGVVIHCAAYTDVDGCDSEPDRAYQVNALGTQNVALACREIDAALVAVSTDYVFDGTKGTPYLEFDQPEPLSVYGRSKLAGERYVQMLLHRFYIVRTSWVYSGDGRNFVNTMLRLSEDREELLVVDDELGSPTYASDLAEALAELIRQPVYGIYHFANYGGCSRHELASEVVRLAGRTTRVVPVSSEEYLRRHPLPARRPADSRLRNFAGVTSLGIQLRPWKEALAAFFEERRR